MCHENLPAHLPEAMLHDRCKTYRFPIIGLVHVGQSVGSLQLLFRVVQWSNETWRSAIVPILSDPVNIRLNNSGLASDERTGRPS
jgi:hypothetical protein